MMKEYLDKTKALHKLGRAAWESIEKERQSRALETGFAGKQGRAFWYVPTASMLELVSGIAEEKGFLAGLELPEAAWKRLNKEGQKKEAYYSSRIEGAVTSLDEAMRCLEAPAGRDYDDESLQMITNNRDALEFMQANQAGALDHPLIHRLQQILVRNTHKKKAITVGAYRRGPVYVVNGLGEVVYEAPAAGEVQGFMDAYVRWTNTDADMHVLIKAALVHLFFVHIHPFDDGNGRSARALSNLYLQQRGYPFINVLAPSGYFDSHRGDYYRAIQNTEAHGHDATFFIIYFLEALAGQLREVRQEIKRGGRYKDLIMRISPEVVAGLSGKMLKALEWMAAEAQPLTTRKYCKLAKCSDETARIDFNKMIKAGLIKKVGQGRTTGYIFH